MSRPRIYTPEEIRERKRLRSAEYRKRNREKIRAYRQSDEYRKRHSEHNRKWREAHPGYNAEHLRKWREENTANRGGQVRHLETGPCRMMSFVCRHCGGTFQREWNGHGKRPHTCEKCAKAMRRAAQKRYNRKYPRHEQMWRIMEELRCRMDAERYARHRALQRERGRKYRERKIAAGILPPRKRNGGMYRPRYSIRFPDWATKWQNVCDVRSQWLVENLTPEQRAYARELAIERKQWRMNNEWRMAR